MANPFKLYDGNTPNTNQSFWYVESDEEAASINDRPGTIIIVNETNNFHMVMVQESGNLNQIVI